LWKIGFALPSKDAKRGVVENGERVRSMTHAQLRVVFLKGSIAAVVESISTPQCSRTSASSRWAHGLCNELSSSKDMYIKSSSPQHQNKGREEHWQLNKINKGPIAR
jgi:hypothetical protein